MAPTHSKHTSKEVSASHTSQTRYIVPIIGLNRPEKQTLNKGEYVVLKCRTDPTDETSSSYDLPIPYFSTGTPEEWLRFVRNLSKVYVGQNLTTGPQQYACIRRLLDGNALTVFELSAAELGNPTVLNAEALIKDLRDQLFPQRALQQQKRYMRRSLRKPRNMSIRVYVNRVLELNDQLVSYPGTGDNIDGTKLPEDEILDLLEFGIPNTWQKAMLLQDFDPQVHTVNDFVQFCERLETMESEEKPPREKHTSNNNSKRKRSSRDSTRNNNSNSRGQKKSLDCLLHGKDCGHSTDQCFVLKKQADKLKSSTRSSQEHNYGDLHTFIKSEIRKANKPRKRSKKASNDLQAFEQLSISDGSSIHDTESHVSGETSDSDTE